MPPSNAIRVLYFSNARPAPCDMRGTIHRGEELHNRIGLG